VRKAFIYYCLAEFLGSFGQPEMNMKSRVLAICNIEEGFGYRLELVEQIQAADAATSSYIKRHL